MRWDRQKVTDEQIEEALRKTKGLITMAARWIGQTYGISITHGAISLRVASSEHLRQVRRWKNRVLRKLEPLLREVDPAVFEREKCQ